MCVQSVPRSQRLQTSPGTYNPITSDFELNRIKIMKQKRSAARSGWAQNVSFDATEARFMELDKRVAPPPGAYTPKTTLADTMPTQNARSGGFGSKSMVSISMFFCQNCAKTELKLFNLSASILKKVEVALLTVLGLLSVPSL